MEAVAQLEGIHGDWWLRYEADRTTYTRDLAELNELAGWTGDHAAVTEVVRGGRRFLAPPKFFGGDPAELDEEFVLAVSLNHATPDTHDYLSELRDLQTRATCLLAHRDYFRQPYVYRPFFNARAKVLGSYAEARGLAVQEDWRAANEQYSLYLERYPTLSRKSRAPARAHEILEAEVFVMALNALAHAVVLGLLRPRAVLLAGKETWPLLPSHEPADVSERIRPDQRWRCPATLDHVSLRPGAAPSTVLRCNFLRTVYGPNADAELAAVGRLLAE